MKHLILYEAFESNILTQLIKFLEKKVNKLSLDNFKKDIFRMREKFDIPTSKIQDKDIVYLKKDKALELRNNKPVESTHHVYCLKFWFSVTNGYLGLSFTGNNVEDYLFFNEIELNYIKFDLGYKTGELIPITDYSLLKHGDFVFLIIESGLPLLARIYISDNKQIYAIQHKYHGSEPSTDDSWNKWGRYSWCLKNSSKILTDHSKIHLYVKNDEPLQVEKDVDVSPVLYNLPTDSNFIPQETSHSFQDEVLNKADFAIAILLENIINKDLKKVSTIKKEREEQKKGAVRLLTDEEIKNINLEKYLQAHLKNTINIDTKEIKNLKNIFLKFLCLDYGFISIYRGTPEIGRLNSIAELLFEFIHTENVSFLEEAVDNYGKLVKLSNNLVEKLMRSYKFVENSESDLVREFFFIIMNIGKKLRNFIKISEIENLEDFQVIRIKLKSIREVFMARELEFSDDADRFLTLPSSQYDYTVNSEDIRKIKFIEKYIDSITK